MSNCFIILAAGKSNRFKSKTPKPFVQYNGDILIKHSINKAILSKKFSKIVVAVNKTTNILGYKHFFIIILEYQIFHTYKVPRY